MDWKSFLNASATITTILGLSAFLALLVSWTAARERRKSLLSRIRGEGVDASQVLPILNAIRKGERGDTLKHLIAADTAIAKRVVRLLKDEVDIEAVIETEGKNTQRFLVSIGVVFLALAIVSVIGMALDDRTDSDQSPTGLSLSSELDTIDIRKDRAIRMNTNGDRVIRTFISNPRVAEIVQFTPTEFGVVGIDWGTTDVSVWTESNNMPAVFEVHTGPDTLDIARLLSLGIPLFSVLILCVATLYQRRKLLRLGADIGSGGFETIIQQFRAANAGSRSSLKRQVKIIESVVAGRTGQARIAMATLVAASAASTLFYVGTNGEPPSPEDSDLAHTVQFTSFSGGNQEWSPPKGLSDQNDEMLDDVLNAKLIETWIALDQKNRLGPPQLPQPAIERLQKAAIDDVLKSMRDTFEAHWQQLRVPSINTPET